MSKSQKQMEKEQERNRKIIDTAFQVFVKRKIEGVSMAEIAEAAGVGRATLFRCYSSKMELVIAVCSVKWKEYLDNLDAVRPISGLHDIPAIDRLTFSLDCYVDMYRNYKELLQFNDNFNYYVTHEEYKTEQLVEFHNSLYSADTRLHMMYEKAKEDKTFRTDIPEEEFMRVTVHTMMSACTYFAGGFIWGAEDNKDYTEELHLVKEMILMYATAK